MSSGAQHRRERTRQTAIRLPETMLRRLDVLVERHRHSQPGITRADIIRRLLAQCLPTAERLARRRRPQRSRRRTTAR